MSCWDRFDRKFLLTVPSSNRRSGFLNSAEKLGLSVETYYNPIVKIESIGCKRINAVRTLMEDPARVSCNLGHYRIIKTALGLGANNVLVFEDDARFLKDKNAISDIIDSMPEDYDVALLDSVNPKNVDPKEMYEEIKRNEIKKWWYSLPSSPRSFCAYAMSRRGMEWFIGCYDYVFDGKPRGMWRLCDGFLKKGCRDSRLMYCCCIPRIAIQASFDDAMSRDHRDVNAQRMRYSLLGSDIDDYDMAP